MPTTDLAYVNIGTLPNNTFPKDNGRTYIYKRNNGHVYVYYNYTETLIGNDGLIASVPIFDNIPKEEYPVHTPDAGHLFLYFKDGILRAYDKDLKDQPIIIGNDTLDTKVDIVPGRSLVSDTEIIKLSKQSGINTGDQDISHLATKTEINDLATKNELIGIASGHLGTIKSSDPAPTPGKNGEYTFSTEGSVSWLPNTPFVSIQDKASVVFNDPIYIYSLIPQSDKLTNTVGSVKENNISIPVLDKINYSNTIQPSTIILSEHNTSIGTNDTRWNNDPFLISGKLTKIQINNPSTRSGTAKIKILSTTTFFYYTVEQEFIVDVVPGINTYTINNFGDIDVIEGQYMAMHCDYVLYGYNATSTGGASAAGNLIGTSAGNSFDSVKIGLYYELTKVIPLKTKVIENILSITTNTEDIEILKLNSRKGNNIIFDETFNTIPSYFNNTGGFSLSNGLASPFITGYNKDFYFNKHTSLDTNKIYVYVTLIVTATKIGVGLKGDTFGAGRLVEFDFENKFINTYAYGPNYDKIILVQTPIPFDPIINGKYLLIVEKNTAKNTNFKLVDLNTSLYVEVINQNVGSGVDGPFISAIAGSFVVNRFRFVTNEPIQSILEIQGDSFVEGSTIADYGIENRYAGKIKTKLNGSCVISGQGGEYAYGLLNKMETDINRFVSKYVIFAIGTNDNLFAQYTDSITQLINHVKSLGSIPILVTITRRLDTDNLLFLRQANAWVKNSGYKYIDFAKCMSLNNDGETQNESLFFDDHIHPNIAGHEKMFQQVMIDIPEIFDTQL